MGGTSFGRVILENDTTTKPACAIGGLAQFVKKLAYGDFFDEFCTVCLRAYGSPGGKRR